MNPALIDKYRHINVEDFNWWADTYEDFVQTFYERTGITLRHRNIHFSGFCSQGDGACFSTERELLADFLAKMDWQDKYPALFADENAVFWVCYRHGFYSHSATMYVELHHDRDEYVPDDPFMQAVEDARYEAACMEHEACEAEMQEFFRSEADRLYRELQKDYEYLTSDDAVWDAIVANELDVVEGEHEDT